MFLCMFAKCVSLYKLWQQWLHPLATKRVSVCTSDVFTQSAVSDNVNGRVALGEGERDV